MKLQSRRQLFLIIALLSAGLTALLYYCLPLPLQPYRIGLQEIKDPVIPNPNVVYHDFDHDGNSEMLALKYQENIHESAAKIYSPNGGLIDQWTFCERWVSHAFDFGDYDKDGTDEAYLFTQSHDSVFLYIIKPDQKTFFIQRRFIDKMVQRNQHGRWDVKVMTGAFIDSDNDDFLDFVFGLMAGNSLQPRCYYVFSPYKNTILYKSETGFANFIGPQIVDLNGDGQPEIVNKGSVATANVPDSSLFFPDTRAWLFIFDKHLRFVRKPLPFGAERSQIQIVPWHDEQSMRLVVLHNYLGAYDKNPCLYLLNANGQILVKRKLPKGDPYVLFTINGETSTKLYLSNGQGYFKRLNKKLQTIKQKYVPSVNGILEYQFDLDGDLSNELIFRWGAHYTITRNDFSSPLSFDLPAPHSEPLVSLKRQNGHPSLLAIQQGEHHFLGAYSKNPFYNLKYPLIFIIFLLFFTGLYVTFLTANYLKSYSHALSILIGNPNRGILILNDRGLIKKANHTLMDQLQLSTVDIINRHYTEIFHNFPQIQEFLTTLFRENAPKSEDVMLGGKHFIFRGTLFGHPIKGMWGYPSGFYFETNDFARPVQDDRLKVWSRTVQKMAHDIKTPLSSISLNLSTVDLKLAELAPEAHQLIERDLKIMLGEMERVREMTKNFLKFTNLEKPNMHPLSLRKLCTDVVESFKSYCGDTITLSMECNLELDMIKADEAQLRMVLNALLENAVDALKGRGGILLQVNEVEQFDRGFEKFVEIEVCNTGKGIPEQEREKIFEPYYTTKKDGTGMGLAIVRKIIADHNGTIELISKENFATVFRIMLPMGNLY